MVVYKESETYTLYGDLDDMTVAELRVMLDKYPDDARVVVRSEKVYVYGGWSDVDREFFLFRWEE
jgi:hypothetical protein